MIYRIFNRYDQQQIISQFSDFTDTYLRKNNYVPIYRILFGRIIISISIIVALICGHHFKNFLSESKGSLLLIVVFFIGLIAIDKKLTVKNGTLVGEYKLGNLVVKYQMYYIPLTTKCSIREVIGEASKEMDFNYNEYIDDSGFILQNQFKGFIRQLTRPQSLINTEEN